MNGAQMKEETIFRTGLIQKMKTIPAGKHIFLQAPGGYGKTVAAGQWLSFLRKKTESISVTDADNDPEVFYRRLARAFLLLTGKAQSLPPMGVTFDRLMETAGRLPSRNPRVYLLIDDLHMLNNEEIIGNLPLIISRLPAYIGLCMASRLEPFPSLLETRRFDVLTKNDLLFTPEEIASLGAEKGRNLTPKECQRLRDYTGGWAIFLSAMLSVKDGEMNIRPQTLTEYLEKRVWEGWEQEIKKTLLCLSVPAEVTPELAGRLTGQEGGSLLARLTKLENTFLSPVREDVYRFHDIFREFLTERMEEFLSKEDIYRLNSLTAEWYYERGEVFNSIQYYFKNRDHDGIIRCERAITVYNDETEGVSVEASYHFASQNVLHMPMSFITENPFLIVECCCAAFWGGDMSDFAYWKEVLEQKLPEIAEKYPDLIETAGFLGSLDPRVPMIEYAGQLAVMMESMREMESPEAVPAHSNTVTQNLPFFHRSMRDYSENHALKEEDLELYRNTFGMMIGDDYQIMEQSLIAGLHYERGALLLAARHAMNGYYACTDETHPETWFSACMILAAALYAMGSSREADRVMDEAGEKIGREAEFLRPNFKAVERSLRAGGADTASKQSAAREWLEVYANHTGQLPFYQIVRHFATLRSYLDLGDYTAAAAFGKRLQTLAEEYARPLDRIESGLLTAIALWNCGEKEEAAALLEEAALIAMPYGFTQLFVNEGDALLPLFWLLREKSGQPAEFSLWTEQLTGEIYQKHGGANEKPLNVSAQQRAMLPYLSKGLPYREIARETGLEVDTVKSHLRLLYKRLGVHNAGEAVIKAKMLGLM